MAEGCVQEELISTVIAVAEKLDWTDSYESSQDGGQKGQSDEDGSDEQLVSEDQWPVSDHGEGGQKGQSDEEREGDDDS